MSSSLEFLDRPPKVDCAGCVVTLHGRGVDGGDLIPMAAMLDLPALRFIFPHGPFPTQFGGRAWFLPPPMEQEGILSSRHLLLELIQKIEAEGTPAGRIALMGFSQGAVMSLDVGLRYPRRLAAIVALSGYLSDPDHLVQEAGPIAQLPVLIAHGTEDEVLPVSGSRAAAKTIESLGTEVSLREYPVGHQINPEEIGDIQAFLERSFARK